MPPTLAPPPRRSPLRPSVLSALAGVLLAAACARPPDDLLASWRAPEGGLPTGVAIRAGTDATFVPPPPPPPRSGGEVAGRAAAGAILYPLAGALGLSMLCGPGVIICLPVAMAIGATAGAAAGIAASAGAARDDIHTPEEVEAAAATLRRVVDPTHIGTCLRETLVTRSGGRLVADGAAASGAALLVRLDSIALGVGADAPLVRGSNPPLILSISASASTRPEALEPIGQTPSASSGAMGDGGKRPSPSGPGSGTWHWSAEPRRYFAATEDEGRALRDDIEVAIGVIAQRILADLYPGSLAPPPTRHDAGALQFRAACPGFASPANAGQTATTGAAAAPR